MDVSVNGGTVWISSCRHLQRSRRGQPTRSSAAALAVLLAAAACRFAAAKPQTEAPARLAALEPELAAVPRHGGGRWTRSRREASREARTDTQEEGWGAWGLGGSLLLLLPSQCHWNC